MKIKELKEIINHTDNHDEDELVVLLSMPSIGPHATSKVQGMYFGFDWDKGHAMIKTEDRVSIKTKEEDVYHMSSDLLMDMATSKSRSYLCKEARQILKKAGYTDQDFEKYRHLFHKDEVNDKSK